MINLATQSYVDFLIQQRETKYALIRSYRDYASGDQTAQLTDAQRELLVGEDGADPEFALNICSTILDVEADRLHVERIAVTVTDDEQTSADLSALVDEWWTAARMDEGQQSSFFSAVRDADSYLIVYPDMENDEALGEVYSKPALAVNKQYDGESSGVDCFYEDGNPKKPMFAVKIWEVQRPAVNNAKNGRTLRKNIYYPDRVEKYIVSGAGGGGNLNSHWRPLTEGDPDYDSTLQAVTLTDAYGNSYAATVAWWTNTGQQGGQPLGLPVFHLRRQARGEDHGRSGIADIVPGVQDAVNQSSVSLMAAALLSGFKVTFATGVDAEADKLNVYPGAILAAQQPDANFGQLAESDLMQLIEVKNTFIKDAAILTSTPLSFFNISGMIPAEGTLKQLEAGLLAKTKRNQVAFGNAIEDAARMMLKLEALYGPPDNVPLSAEQIDDLEIACKWTDPETRSDETNTAIAERWAKLKVPDKYIWRKLGFSEDEIAEFELDATIKRQQAMAMLGSQIAAQEAANEQQASAPPQQPVGVAAGRNGNGNGANLAANRSDSATSPDGGVVSA